MAVVVALGQRQLEPATFEFGHTRKFRGTVELTPYPSLRVTSGNLGPRRRRYQADASEPG